MLIKLCIEQFRRLPALSKQGYGYLLVGIALTFIINMLSDTLGTIALLLTFLSAIMCRDPERAVPSHQNNIMLSPVDGMVTAITHIEKGEILGLPAGRYHLISIWQSFIDVHVLRAPFSGSYQVSTPEFNSEDFDSSRLLMNFTATGQNVAVLLPYSYLFAPTNLPIGAISSSAGTKVAWLKLGGAIECYVPADHKLSIRQGQKLIAGETVLA